MLKEFEVVPGTRILFDHQVFRCETIAPLLRDDGSDRGLVLVWETRCPHCFAPFFFTTAINCEFRPSRRCAAHRAPGKPVFPKGGRKQERQGRELTIPAQ
ncbi:hypothetical protein AS026_13945 [Rhizobium altiplani]|uniref:Uncharacterized protein n=1 Tax=Rhizobium altiplani TaxID=1864509 RepID=A0A109JDR4_9HYPH|nr:hypothetical protein [Rhizobium altiplani]KWV47067.1 hypothetical protein AS026_13945 [Rhizobium altiplani]